MRVSGPSATFPEAPVIPAYPTLPVQPPSSPFLSLQSPPPVSSEETCTTCQAPVVDHGRFDRLSYGQIHELRSFRGYSKDVSTTRSASMRRGGNRRILSGVYAMDTPITVTGKGGRRPAYMVESLTGPTRTQY